MTTGTEDTMEDDQKSYVTPIATATASPASPSAEEYQRLVHEVSDLRRHLENREIAFRNDIVRERRRRELMEDALRSEFRMHHRTAKATEERMSVKRLSVDEESLDESTRQLVAPGGISLTQSALNPKKNNVNFKAMAKRTSILDESNRSAYLDTSDIQPGGLANIASERENKNELEGTEIPLLPQDTFSFLAFSKVTSFPMFIALFVISVQVLTLTVLFGDMFGEGEPGNILGIPKGLNQSTATIQVVAIFIITVAQTDLHDSLNTLFIGYQEYELTQITGRPVKRWRWEVSLWVRISITLYAMGVTFIMICTESDATQVLLDFTSIEFVTNLDNIFFWLCAYGYMGFSPQRDATLVLQAKPSNVVLTSPDTEVQGLVADKHKTRSALYRSESTRLGIAQERQRHFPRLLFTASLFAIMMIGWAIIFNWVRQGEFLCQTIFVQFTDDVTADLAPFTGLYDIGCSDQVPNCRRVKYGESKHGMHGNFSDTAKFAYCVDKAVWGFTFGENTGDVLAHRTTPCNAVAQSKIVLPKVQDSYNIMSTASDPWKVLNSRQVDVPFKLFELRCFDCRHLPLFCGGPDRGECVNNRCECKNGWYGRRCEFTPPCELIEFADLEQNIVDGRRFATQYKRMYNEIGHPVEIYDRPVYYGIVDDGDEIGSTNQVFFNGLRWVLVTDLYDLLRSEQFHGYWTAKWGQYTVDFYSDAVLVDSPQDTTSPEGLKWYHPLPKRKNRNVQGVDLATPAPFHFLCATCDDETNPCLYDGICRPDTKECECISGSSGRLCQILPTGNGRCDPDFNTKEYAWDGGDCCAETCVSTDEHTCGRDKVLNSNGVESFGFVGFNNCQDPSVAKVVSGSRTIFDIQDRGKLNCGVIFTTTWFYNFMIDQCRAVAAAVLDDPNAIQLFNFTNDRFRGLHNQTFDIVFWTDYTASRDVYETSARSGFNYAKIPYYFGGFVFAGIKPFGLCANEGDFFSPQCLAMKICLIDGTTWFDAASKIFPSQTIVTYKDFESTVVGLENKECNVIGGSQVDVELISIRPYGFTGDAANYEVGSRLYAKSFETWITRTDDRVWSMFTSWVFEALVQAEESNITQSTSDLMGTSDVFGEQFENMFRRAVAAVGNYGELWERNLPFTRSGMNLINDGSSGGMISYDFGRVSDIGPGPSTTSAIRSIVARESLRCGIVGESFGFAEYDAQTRTWSGFDIDLCRGIAAALFDGDDSKMVISLVTVANRFTKINNGDVDIVPGSTRTLEREVNFGVNNDAFDFSPVYFHDGMIFAGEMPYAKCAENQDFTNATCTGTKICVPRGSTWEILLEKTLGIEEQYLLTTNNFADSIQLHLAGVCNVVVGESGRLHQQSLKAAGHLLSEDYYVGTQKFNKEPICLMHRSDDPQFSDLIKWIMFGFFYAEENGITSADFFDMPETMLFGSDLAKFWQHAIRRVGNYGEIYERNLGQVVPRTGLNLLNDLSSPQLFAAPGTV